MNARNVFISHYGEDDAHVQNMKALLDNKGCTLRNSSIDSTKPNDAKNAAYITSLLRDGIQWAGCVIVLVGNNTHTRPWVDQEIEMANRQGKRIIGVYARGCTDATLPSNFELFGDALVGWNADKILAAIDGTVNNWEKISGEPRESVWSTPRETC